MTKQRVKMPLVVRWWCNVCRVIDRPNASRTQCAKLISHQRTTPYDAGIGPDSTISTSGVL
jgi:hypothetical protein